jgi:hypothetical protein
MQATTGYAATAQQFQVNNSQLTLVTNEPRTMTELFYKASFSVPRHDYFTRRPQMVAHTLEAKITLDQPNPGVETSSDRVESSQITEPLDQLMNASLQQYTNVQDLADTVAEFESDIFQVSDVEITDRDMPQNGIVLVALPIGQVQHVVMDLPTHISFEVDRLTQTTKVFYERLFSDLRYAPIPEFAVSTRITPRAGEIAFPALQRELDLYTFQALQQVTATNNSYEAISTSFASFPMQLSTAQESENIVMGYRR